MQNYLKWMQNYLKWMQNDYKGHKTTTKKLEIKETQNYSKKMSKNN